MHNVFLLAGPAGSGKDSILDELIRRHSNIEFAINAVTRAPRPAEVDGKDYHFMTNEKFLKLVADGTIPEHYYRKSIDAYYGLYKPDVDERLARGKIVAVQAQLEAAKYLKQNYGATTFFIMPHSMEEFEHRVRSRAPMSDAEWQERKEFTEREIREEAPFYDYQIHNDEGRLLEAADEVEVILKKVGFVLQ